MSKLQPVRGTHDLLPREARLHRHITGKFSGLAERYGFAPIDTPIFEFTEVFDRTLGETTDVVTKEMYTFDDRGGDSITLRPELTAGVARAFISGGLSQHLPLKYFSHGPMFRYERPQKGRQRQFHQLNVEVLGVSEPQADIEVIALGAHLLEELGVSELVTLELNTLGDSESRQTYRDILVEFLQDHKADISAESVGRLTRNPLRILDSKDERDRKVLQGAPRMSDHLNAESTEFFGQVCAGLEKLGVRFVANERLVRGFDYYTHTAFEFTTQALGAQGTVIGGGRYDHLIEVMGGPSTAGIGWGSGIERLAMLINSPPEPVRPIFVVPVGELASGEALGLTQDLRRAGLVVELGFRGNVGKRMKQASKANARLALLFGEDEIAAGTVTVRDLDDGSQQEIPRGRLTEALKDYRLQVDDPARNA